MTVDQIVGLVLLGAALLAAGLLLGLWWGTRPQSPWLDGESLTEQKKRSWS